jgi:hypothetical protein
LEKSGAALVHVEGKPVAVLTRADLLAFYAASPPALATPASASPALANPAPATPANPATTIEGEQ